MKHVDRDKVFARLEQILSTVKINPVAAPAAEQAATVDAAPAAASNTVVPVANSDVTASTPTTPSPETTPAAPSTSESSPQ
jgi:hypothetical protein